MSIEMSAKHPIPYGYERLRKTFPSYIGDRHLCTIGPTRSGKGATVIMQALLRAPHSLVVIDPKGQNAAVTAAARRAMGQDVFVINPFGLHGGAPWHLPRHRFNPLSQLDLSDPNVVGKGRAIAQALIVTESRDPYFDDTARDLVTAVNFHVVEQHGKDGTLAHTRKIITDVAARGLDAARHLNRMSKSPYPFISQPIGRFMAGEESRDISAACNTAITQTGWLDDGALTDPKTGTLTGNDIDLRQLKRKPTTVYLILPGELMDSYSRFLRVLITNCINQVISEPGGHPVLMILDEAGRLDNLPSVTAGFSYAAGCNLVLWPFFQNIGLMQEVYPKEWSTILENCGLVQFLTPGLETAEYIQRRGGTMTGETRSRSYTGTIFRRPSGETRSETRVPLLPIERVMSMGPDESLVFFAGRHEPLLAGRRPYWTIPRLADLYDPDPFHMP